MVPHPADMPSAVDAIELERALSEFVRGSVSELAKAATVTPNGYEERVGLERGSDGVFRERKTRVWLLPPMVDDDWLCRQWDYQRCVDLLKLHAAVGTHLDMMVGTETSQWRFDANLILRALIAAMLDSDGHLTFSDERFHSKWRGFVAFCANDQVVSKMVAPLPNLIAPFPIGLNEELALDRFTDDEADRLYRVGVLQPDFPGTALIYGRAAVGIRRTTLLRKLKRQPDEPTMPLTPLGEGSFGKRPHLRDDLTIDDVLLALRLFKRTTISTAGFASWMDALLLSSSTSFRSIGQWPHHGHFELTENEVPSFLNLWQDLEQRATQFRFGLHRFNLAFDRETFEDRVVDLIIAAEALFLGDTGAKDRGEMRFRLAVRAANFVEHPKYGERDIFNLMRKAYDIRSAIVHGDTPKATPLPGNPSADPDQFITEVEEVVRLGLRKALTGNNNVRDSQFWESLLFGVHRA